MSDEHSEDLFWHALNYRGARFDAAQGPYDQLEACVGRKIASAVAEERERCAATFKEMAERVVALHRELKVYREREKTMRGLSVTNGAGGAWLLIEAPSGKKAAISLEALGAQRGGIVGATVLEWVDALKPEDES